MYVGRILNGKRPAKLPIMQATKFELIINAKTAKTLGIIVPGSLLAGSGPDHRKKLPPTRHDLRISDDVVNCSVASAQAETFP